MLVLDSTIGCIEADESQVLVLYRSAPIVMTPVPGSRPASMEAYVCGIQGKSQTKVHLVFVADNRRIYVYSESLKGTDATGIERSLQQAIGCANSMGFAPELVDLNYRPAMREVVLRNIKILRSPGNKAIATLRPGLPGAPILPAPVPAGTQHDKKPLQVAAKAAAPAPASANPTPPPAAVATSAGSASLRGAPAPAASPALSRGERSSVGILQLEKELQLMAAERDALLAQLQQLSAVHQEVLMELTVQRDEATKVTTDLDRLKRSEAELKTTVADRERLAVEVRDLTAKLQELQRGVDEREEVNSSLTAELDTAKKEAKALLTERETLRQKAESATTQAEKMIEENRALRDELDDLRTVSEAELVRMSSLEQDLFTLVAELGTATTEAATARTELVAAVTGMATAEAELLVARSKLVAAEAKIAAMSRSSRVTELELEKSRAELAAIGSELPANPFKETAKKAAAARALPEQSRVITQTAVPEQSGDPKQAPALDNGAQQAPALDNRPEPQRSQREEPHAVTDLRQAVPLPCAEDMKELNPALFDDLASADQIISQASSWYGVDAAELVPALADALTPASGLQQDPGETAPTPPQAQAHDFPPFGELQESFFSCSADPAPVGQFVLRPDLEVIEYLKPEDVVELYQSINNANMAPDGKGQESCCGYICSLKCGERLLVFAAIYGTRSGRTSVYAPETQPGDEASYAAVLRSAITFAEEVGLMMEAVKGGAAVLKADCIVQCPVLKKAA